MKNILLLLLIVPLFATAQKDLCKEIQKKVDKSTGSINYMSPYFSAKVNAILSRDIDGRNISDRISLSFTSKYSENTPKKIYLRFGDASILAIEKGTAMTAPTSDNNYLCIVELPVDQALKEKLKKNKITKIKIGDFEQAVPELTSGKIRGYATCIWNK